MKLREFFAGAVSGVLNGLFGSGGGVAAVLFLRSLLGDEQKAHASATLMILIMSTVSLTLYALGGHVDFAGALPLLPAGAAGAVAGTVLLKKLKPTKIKKLFGAVMAISGAVMIFL